MLTAARRLEDMDMGCCGQNTTGAGATAVDTGKRVNYTKGMLLGDVDFVQEQAWHIARRHELTREVLGYGTVRGLKLGIDLGTVRVRVSPGVACMPSGTPVCVGSEQCCDVDAWLGRNWPLVQGQAQIHPLALHVVLAYDSCLTDAVPVPGEPCRSDDQLTVPSRIADCYTLELRVDAPYQVEEDAIRDFADWLAHVPVDPTSPPMSEEDFMQQLRDAANAWLEPTSPHIGDFMFGSPPPALGSTDALLRAALRLWATELRPVWRSRYGCGPNPVAPGDRNDAILLATLSLDVDTTSHKVNGPITIDESRRPVLLSLRMVQELIAQNPAPEPAHGVEPETAYAQAPRVGMDTAYARADHSHGTPPLPVLEGEVVGPVDDTVVARLLGHGFDGTPVEGDTLVLSESGDWVPGHLPLPADTVTDALRFGLPAEAGSEETRDYARTDHSHGTPTLRGDVEAEDEEGDSGLEQHVRVIGLQHTAVDEQAPSTGQVLTCDTLSDGRLGWAARGLPAQPQPSAVTAQLSFGAAKFDGTDNSKFARADHTHGTPPLTGDVAPAKLNGKDEMRVVALQGREVRADEPQDKQVLTYDKVKGLWGPADAQGGGGPAPATAPPPGLNFGGAGVVGSGAAYALGNHTHSLPALPALGGDLSGTIGSAFIESLQKVPVKATKPKSGDVLTCVENTWVPRPGSLIEIAAAGVLAASFDVGATGLSTPVASGPVKLTDGGGNQAQVVIEVDLQEIPEAGGPRSGFVVKLTPMWNDKKPVMVFVDAVRASSATSVAFRVVFFSTQGLLGSVQRVHYELSRFVPFKTGPNA